MYTGKKIRLRAYRKEDIVPALQFVNDPEIKKYLVRGVPYLITLPEEEKWFEENMSSKDTYSFAIETLKENKYIGGCGVNKVDWKNSVATLGIFIGDKKYLGKGYGTDALNVLIKFIFDQMNMNKINLGVFSYNPRAIKCYEKCGFKLEGVQRKELFRDGRYYDICLMGILRDEYLKRKT